MAIGEFALRNIKDSSAKALIHYYNKTYGSKMPFTEYNMKEAKSLIYEHTRVLGLDRDELYYTLRDFSEIIDDLGEEPVYNMGSLRNIIGHYRYEVKLSKGEI